MPFVDLDLDQDYEPKPVPEGEYNLRIVKAEDKESKKGNQMTQVLIAIEDNDYPNAAPINHYLVYPNKDTEEQTRQIFMQNIKRFLKCFDVKFDASGFNTEDLVGETGTCLVVVDPPGKTEDGTEFPEKNSLRLPRVQE